MKLKRKRIAILIFPDVEELDFVGTYEILAGIGKVTQKDVVKVELVGTRNVIKCSNGLKVMPHRNFINFNNYDIIVIPGGKGIDKIIKNKRIMNQLKSLPDDKLVYSVCTGAIVLGEAGLLKNKKATTHFLHRDRLKKYCTVVSKKVVVDRNIITAGGISSSLNLGLRLIEILFDKETAKKMAKRIEFNSSGY